MDIKLNWAGRHLSGGGVAPITDTGPDEWIFGELSQYPGVYDCDVNAVNGAWEEITEDVEPDQKAAIIMFLQPNELPGAFSQGAPIADYLTGKTPEAEVLYKIQQNLDAVGISKVVSFTREGTSLRINAI